jgi:hypothetical protein
MVQVILGSTIGIPIGKLRVDARIWFRHCRNAFREMHGPDPGSISDR